MNEPIFKNSKINIKFKFPIINIFNKIMDFKQIIIRKILRF